MIGNASADATEFVHGRMATGFPPLSESQKKIKKLTT